MKPSQRETARELYFTACSDRSLDFDYAVRYGILSLDNGRWVAGWKKRHARRLLVIVCTISSNPPRCLTHVFRKDLGPWGKWN